MLFNVSPRSRSDTTAGAIGIVYTLGAGQTRCYSTNFRDHASTPPRALSELFTVFLSDHLSYSYKPLKMLCFYSLAQKLHDANSEKPTSITRELVSMLSFSKLDKARFFGALTAVMFAGSLFATSAHSAAISVTDPGTGNFSGTPYSLGWQFTPTQNITVTDLGIFDDTGSGLVGIADIAIFTNAGVSLVSTALAAGTGAPLIDGFRYASVAPTMLAAGTTYVIGSYYVGTYYDFDTIFNPVFTTDAAIGFDSLARYDNASSLVFPSLTVATDRAYIGPNFLFSATAVPEPAALGIFGLALAGLALAARRRRNTR